MMNLTLIALAAKSAAGKPTCKSNDTEVVTASLDLDFEGLSLLPRLLIKGVIALILLIVAATSGLLAYVAWNEILTAKSMHIVHAVFFYASAIAMPLLALVLVAFAIGICCAKKL